MLYRKYNLKSRSRSGVTLLFVVSMIVLFLLMGTAFVLVSNDYFRAARQRSKRHIYSNDSDAIVERAFYDLFRGPELTNNRSPLRGHSLLADMYGYGLRASIASASVDTSEHFINLTLNNDVVHIIDGSTYAPDPIPGLLSGQVLTFVSGVGKGLSTRIVDHQVSNSGGSLSHSFILLPITKMDNGFRLANATGMTGDQVVINGRPFSGTGAGNYDPFVSRNQPALSETALDPNQSGRSLADIIGASGDGYFSVRRSASFPALMPNSMGPNEGYDAFDFQNMFLASLNPDGTVGAPSFHRDDLISRARGDFRAIRTGGVNNDGIVVDNNNDGEPDGIWVDAGIQTQVTSNGALVKPLVSYTVIDMGGKANINAHGSILREVGLDMSEIELLGATEPGSRGQGYGPPEFNLSAVTPSAISLLQGSAGTPGRYGADGMPGQPGVRDDWSRYKLFGYPDGSFDQSIPGTVNGSFGSAMDVHGRFAVGYPNIIDVATVGTPNEVQIGMPVANVGFSNLPNEIADSPYEMSFVSSPFLGPIAQRFDAPFQPAELEAVLRQRDLDANMLPKRLITLGLSGSDSNSVTTDSYEVPTTYESLPQKLYQVLNSGISGSVTNRDARIRDSLGILLPPEAFRGLPMNVNREFGDGIDNNGNGVIDEFGEAGVLDHPAGEQVEFDEDNDGVVSGDSDSFLARSNFARHLYVVTLLCTEPFDSNGAVRLANWYDFNGDGGQPNQEDLLEYRRVIAQWAINCVDFRDRDSIMTAFEVDLNPWDGWDVDGDLTSTETNPMREVFWGAERPELLITETMATHDRRTQDLNIELVPDGETAGRVAAGEDTDFDSHLVPKVSVFFELYNPWVMNDANQVRPGELYDSQLKGVELQKTSPDGSSPVWRLEVTKPDQKDDDPDKPKNNTHTRRIYFSEPAFRVDSGPKVYYPEGSIQSQAVGPGRYAIVGTQGRKVGDRYDTYFGRRLTPDAIEPEALEQRTRRISMDPVKSEVETVKWNADNQEFEVETRSGVPVLPIGLNDGGWFRELGVSDPEQGYFNLDGVGGIPIEMTEVVDGFKFTESATTGAPLDFAFDQPVDQMIDADNYNEFLKNDGLAVGYRVVHLQRLANPLLPFNADTNPYRTIDSSAIDLFAFGGAEPAPDPNNLTDPTNLDGSSRVQRMGSFERRGDVDSQDGQLAGRHRMLFKNDRNGRVNATNEYDGDENGEPDVDDNYFEGLDSHVLSRNFTESFGVLNDAYRDSVYPNEEPGLHKPFCWLTWNNRPYVSQLELVNVPHTSSYWLTRLFGMNSDKNRNVYSPPSMEQDHTEARNYTAHFPHLLNFYSDNVTGVGGTTNATSLHRVFNYLEVPSRFVGTESHVNPITFAGSNHGVSFGLKPPFDTISSYRYPGKVNLNTITDSRVWSGLMGFYAVGTTNQVSFQEWIRSRDGTQAGDIPNPLRPARASNLVPLASQIVEPAECGLFRKKIDGASMPQPLLDYNSPPVAANADTDRAAYFKYDMRQRLGNMVTNRSSVFSIWITVGYFEVDPDGSLRTDASGNAVEAGADSGSLRRERGFFMVDRSIPVAFEPGKNHNVDRAVLLKTLIE